MSEEEQVQEPGRVEVGEVRDREPAVRGLEAFRIVRQLERESIGVSLPSSRQRGLERESHELEQSSEQ